MNKLLQFFADNHGDVLQYVYEHIEMTGIAVGLAVLAGVPLGIAVTKSRHLRMPVLSSISAIQTVPSLALLGFMMPLMGILGLPSIGRLPVIVALFLYALLPIVRNTYAGIKEVDPALIEAATGMGMTPQQVLMKVQLPLSIPVIMAGVRTAAVITVGIATLGALIGAGGLGTHIWRGMTTVNPTLILAGAIPASLLALGLDFGLGRLEKTLSPRGIRPGG